MYRMARMEPRRWSLARQLVVLQLCVVVTAVAIEAMVAVYNGPRTVESLEQRQILGLVTLTEVALLVGIAGSLFIADRVRRQTFDMEPAEIARRYQHHDAMLHAVREGLIITNVAGDIMLANDEARRLLELADNCEGKALRDHVAGSKWAATETPVTDELRYAPGRVLMVSRSQAEVDGMPAGMVTTLRDRTELQQALRELSQERILGDELRKQAHEHANDLQMIIILIETKKYREAIEFCAKSAEMPQKLSGQVLDQATDPVLATCLQILHGRAVEQGVELLLDGTLNNTRQDIREDLVVIIRNLVNNAIDAASARREGGWVRLSLAHGADGLLRISVRDNGRGITVEPITQVFAPGYTTKDGERGFGLALVRDKVSRLHGRITPYNDGGAVFEVCIPEPREQAEE